MLRVAWAFINRDVQQMMSYKLHFVGSLLGIPFFVAILYFLSGVFDAPGSLLLRPYGGNYFAFLLVGSALYDFATLGLLGFSQSVRDSQMMGTLEIMLLSPTRLPILIICSSLMGYILTSARVVMYLTAATLLFGLDIGRADLRSAGVVLLLSIICFAGLGILVSSAIMVFKQVRFLETLFNMVFFMLGGVMYPVEALPRWLGQIAQWLPITHALNGMRQALMRGVPLGDLGPSLAALVGFSAVFFPLGLLAFSVAVHRVKITGTLSQY